MTNDKDFGEIVFKQRRLAAGVLLLRLAGVRRTDRESLLLRAVKEHGTEFGGAFSVLTENALRIRQPESTIAAGADPSSRG